VNPPATVRQLQLVGRGEAPLDALNEGLTRWYERFGFNRTRALIH
jgi:hypothetical protein